LKSRIVCFELKALTIHKSILTDNSSPNVQAFNNESHNDYKLKRLKNKVYKDEVFKNLGTNLCLSKKDKLKLKDFITSDELFLRRHGITDFSFLVSVHNFSEVESFQLKNDFRVFKSSDNKYLYCFTLIDFENVFYSLIKTRYRL